MAEVNKPVLQKSSKARTVLFMVLIASLVVAFFSALILIKGASEDQTANQSVVRGAPSIESIPGVGTTTAEYADLQRRQNIQIAKEAGKTGKSAIPTLIGRNYGCFQIQLVVKLQRKLFDLLLLVVKLQKIYIIMKIDL